MRFTVATVAACCGLMLASCSQGPIVSPPMRASASVRVATITRYRILGNFDGINDGSHPTGSLAPWLKLLYGTAPDGGSHGKGTIFRITPNGNHPYVLHSFEGGQDGCTPMGGVLFGTANVFYGTASSCGDSTQGGIIFSGHTSSKRIQIMHAFDLVRDGGNPHGVPLLIGTTLYGTTRNGGAHGKGTIYSIDVKTNAFTVLHAFGSGNDAANPMAGFTELGGKLFGTSYDGGSDGAGTIYEFDPRDGAEKVLHSFDRTDGARPTDALSSSGGLLYGVTLTGGVSSAGTIFKFDPAGGHETVLYNFGHGDAIGPQGPPVTWKDELYGTTTRGGKSGRDLGTIFRYVPATKSFEELYAFAGKPDGAHPRAGLRLSRADGIDHFFGTTSAGGADDLGTAFSFIP